MMDDFEKTDLVLVKNDGNYDETDIGDNEFRNIIQSEIDGRKITTIIWKGKPYIIAKELGAALGYADDGKRLIINMLNEWSAEFIEPKTHLVLKGEELRQLRLVTENVTSLYRAGSITLLTEKGFYLVIAKTNKPIGIKIRDYMATKVFPQIARNGKYSPSNDSEDTRRKELDIRREELDTRRKEFELNAIKDLIDKVRRFGHVSEDVILSTEVSITEQILGYDFNYIKPETEKWYSPTEMGEYLAVSPQAIGRKLKELGLHDDFGDKTNSKRIINKSKSSDRTVFTYVYSEEIFDKIKDVFTFSEE